MTLPSDRRDRPRGATVVPLRPRDGAAARAGDPVSERARDAALVARARDGDPSAVDALFRRHLPAVASTVARLIGRRQDAEDVAQEALAVALDELDDLRDAHAFRAWLLQLAVRQVHRYFRRRKLLRALGLDRGADDATLAALAAPGASADARAELAALDRALAALPTDERIAWALRYVEGEQLEDVARACGCSLATIKRRIAAADTYVRARVHLREEPRDA